MLTRKAINARGNGTFIRQITWYTTFVLGICFTDVGRVVDETVFRCVAFGFQSTERERERRQAHCRRWMFSLPKQSLFRTQDLNRRRGIFGQIRQTTGMRDQTRSDLFTNQVRQVRCDLSHFTSQILTPFAWKSFSSPQQHLQSYLLQTLSVFEQMNDAIGERFDVDQIDRWNVHAWKRSQSRSIRHSICSYQSLFSWLRRSPLFCHCPSWWPPILLHDRWKIPCDSSSDGRHGHRCSYRRRSWSIRENDIRTIH